MTPWRKALLYAGLLGLLALVFRLYGDPDFMLTIAQMTWGCF